MCGIAGIFNLDSQPIALSQLRAMADLLRHRGPDDEGFALFDTTTGCACHLKGPDSPAGVLLPDVRDFNPSTYNLALAERRLAILDLSQAAHTPMVTPDHTLTLTFNGEIYNYIELRAELAALGHTFHTRGDTEVLLAAYRQWGTECVTHFNGMWAFALWDAVQKRLFCSRDRFGVKPFYYVHQQQTFAFASEPKALWGSGLMAARPNRSLLLDFLAGYEANMLDETMFEQILQLPGGYNLIATSDGLHSERYWSLPCNTELGPAHLNTAEFQRLREMLTDAVRLRLRADVPIGTCLSGGLDSSAIVTLTNGLMQREHSIQRTQVGEHQKTFTACYADAASDERQFAQLIVNRTDAEWHQVFPTLESLRADLQKFIWHHDEPPITTSMYAQWCVMRKVREQGVIVTLDGQGSDELLAGYLPFDVYLSQLLRAGQLRRLVTEAHAIAQVGSRSSTDILKRVVAYQMPTVWQQALQRAQPARTLGLRPADAAATIMRHQKSFDANTRANLPLHLQALATYNLPRLLRSEDRNSMAFSVEARTPFLDVRLAEYISQLPASYRIHNGWSKYVLRQAMTHVLPAEIVWRRDKKGFATPEQQWVRGLRPTLLELFNDSPRIAPLLDMGAVCAALGDANATSASLTSSTLWRWIAAELWLRMVEHHSVNFL